MCHYCSNNQTTKLPLSAGTLNFHRACQNCINRAINNGGSEYDVRRFTSVKTSTHSNAQSVPHKYSWETRNESDYLLIRHNY